MADVSQRYDDNVPGKFYVDTDCIYCGLCSEIAPKNFSPSESLDHDVVIRQPVNEEELDLCIEALDSCPVESIGDDCE